MNVSDTGYPRLDREDGEWVLVLARTLDHSIEDVWAALTEAEQLPSWAPFRTDKDLTSVGAVRLDHIDMPEEDHKQGAVLEVDEPRLLVFRWGDDILRWELSGDGNRTFLVLRHRFADRKQAPSYAAGWHLCLDGLAGVLAGKEMPSMVGHQAYNFGYDELYAQYAEKLGAAANESTANREGKFVKNVTALKINKPARDVFEAIVDPARIGNFWFSSSSARWEPGKTITLRYDEYDAEGDIVVTDIVENRKIAFESNYGDHVNTVTITLTEQEAGGTVVEIAEDGFPEKGEGWVDAIVDNKGGWVYMLACLKAYLEFGVTALRAALVK